MLKTKIKKLLIFAAFLCISSVYAASAQAGFTRDIVFPVDGPYSFQDDFGDPRSGGREHEANDIIAPKHTPVVAAVDGRIRYLVIPEASWGYAIYLEDDEDWQYRYLHLNNDNPGTDDGNGGPEYAYAPGISRGVEVTAGQLLGWVGDSGNAESTAAHLHFEIRRPDGTAINPYESLRTAESSPPASASGAGIVTKIIIPHGGVLIQYAGSPKVYLLADGVKHHIADELSFNTLGFDWNSIRTVPESEQYRTSVPIRLASGQVAVFADGTPVNVAASETIAYSNSYVFSSRLDIGSRGEEVSELQKLLKELGYFTYPTITGYYGTVTRDAVIAFQRARGIDAVGFVGPQTRAALNSY